MELAVAGLLMSAKQAREQNKAIEQQQQAQRQAAMIQQTQLAEAANVERTKRMREAAQIRARLRVSGAESGVSMGSLQRQADFDAQENLGIIGRNLALQQSAVQSGAQANINSLKSQRINPILAGIQGGISGASAGLNILGGIRDMTAQP